MIETVNKESLDRVKREKDALLRDFTGGKRALGAAHEVIARFLESQPKKVAA